MGEIQRGKSKDPAAYLCGPCGSELLQYVARQILILDNLAQHLLHVGRVHLELLSFLCGSVKADLVEHALHNRMQTSGADVFCAFVHAKRKARDFFERFGRELQLHAFGFEQRDILPGQRGLGLGQDADEVLHGERLQFHAYGEAALQFWNQIARLRDVERAGGHEQDVVGADHAVTRVDGGAFDDGKDVALHAFTRDVRTMAAFTAGDLVDFIEEDDAGVLDAINGDARDLLHVDQALLFFLDQVLERLVDLHLSLLGTLAEDVRQHILEIDVHLLNALVGDDFERRKIAFASFDLDGAVVEFAFAQLLTQFLAGAAGGLGQGGAGVDDHASRGAGIRRTRRDRRQKNIEQALFRVQFRFVGDVFEFLFADHFNSDLDQVADHGFHIAADVADFRELGSFDLQERRVSQLGETAGDFGFADAGGPDHNDVLVNDLFGHFGRELLAAHAIAQGDGDGALRVFLTGNVLAEIGDDFAPRPFLVPALLFFTGSG